MVRKLTVGLVSAVMALVVSAVLTKSVHAGSLEPPGPPAPTMKTLDQIAPTWDQVLPAAQRFVLVMGNAAVLDKETGLVWEKDPLTITRTWSDARLQCTSRTTGGRKGWRLPSVHELASLVDSANPDGNPDLPPVNPFLNVSSNYYWAATAFAEDSNRAWLVGFGLGDVSTSAKSNPSFSVWCVRGGQSHGDSY